MQKVIRSRIDANGSMQIKETDRAIDFGAVKSLLLSIQEEVSAALEEVSKGSPDETELCVHGIEGVEELLDDIKALVLPVYDRTIYGYPHRGIMNIDTTDEKIEGVTKK